MFIEIKGKGHVNINQVVMVSNKINNKYVVTLSHGGKITVSKGVRDKIVKSDPSYPSYSLVGVDDLINTDAEQMKSLDK